MPGRAPIRTQAIVLQRTKYGETDRILNLLTPEGKVAVMAKGARREKSKLAGGIELFCLSEVVLYQGKSELYTLTSAKMLQFYSNIMADWERLELASQTLKQVSRLAEQITTPELFNLLKDVLAALHGGVDPRLVTLFVRLNLARISGEEYNLYFDTAGEQLRPDATYRWNSTERALEPAAGPVGVNHIKLLRLMVTAPLSTVARVRGASELVDDLINML